MSEPVRKSRIQPVPFREQNNLHTHLILWGHFLVFGGALTFISQVSQALDDCPLDLPPKPLDTLPPCGVKDMLERPNIYVNAGIFAVLMCSLLAYRTRLRKLKRVAFICVLAITTVLRGLSAFAGSMTQERFYWVPTMWGSLGRPMWMWFLVEAGFWSWSYLGVYEDYWFEPESRTVVNDIGTTVWKFTSQLTGDEGEDSLYYLYSPHMLQWQDVGVRLAYITMVETIVQCLWLRYGFVYAPYTPHINNSEILTALLFISLSIYTYARLRTHIIFLDDKEIGHSVSIFVPMSQLSLSTDLLTLASPALRFRKTCPNRQALIFCGLFFSALVVATLHTNMVILWWVLAKVHIMKYMVARDIQNGYTEDEAWQKNWGYH